MHDEGMDCYTFGCSQPHTRATEIEARNRRNRDLHTARVAWMDHLDPGHDPPDFRTEVQYAQGAELDRKRLAQRAWFAFERHDSTYARYGRIISCGVIDEGDVIFGWCEPRAILERIRQGLSAGIGDAPGSARVIPDCGPNEDERAPYGY